MARSIGVAHLALMGVVGLVGLGGCSVVVGGVLNGKSGDGGVASDTGVAECTSGPQCDDTNPCTADTCMDRHCVNMSAFNGRACGAAAECNMGTCVPCPGGVCVPPMLCTGLVDCNDFNDCTTDNCDPPSGTPDGCTHKLVDADGDSYITTACGGADCDDANSAVHPGATEVCNGIDDDCDGTADNVATTTVWYVDADLDGYGSPLLLPMSPMSLADCTMPSGYVKNDGDCDDNNDAAHPYPTGDVIPFFDVHRGDGSFDYDCDGFETKQYGPPVCAAGGFNTCAGVSCIGTEGFVNAVTVCGMSYSLFGCAPCGTTTSCLPATLGPTTVLKCH